MLNQIKGLHHVTSMAASARQNNGFFTDTLGLRRVKKTVNFDAPDVYHLYYGDEAGTPGSVMTYFPFPHIARGRPGTGEVGTTLFSVPEGSLGYWQDRLSKAGVDGLKSDDAFGNKRLHFAGPDDDGFALVEVRDDTRAQWTGNGVGEDQAIRGFQGASLRLRDEGATTELLKFMGYEEVDRQDGVLRLGMPGGNGADVIYIETMPNISGARLGAGSVHHIAFAVENREKQLEVRKALMDTGYQVTPVIDRDYFWAIYFRTPGGVLFEVATNEPGFDRDEDTAHLGEALKLPSQHAHLRAALEKQLEPLGDEKTV
ncbi:VOC family protein [Agrobacterium fabrum]|uniref:VOC family protein n=1 Tax=Agrobacterium fabrum TaxID=1176649 RepID=UPI0015739AE6|nr:VOC family protein [Agrobacterium fabrum]NTB08342.1 ring-cleaving dioxygenase [Agrobacterium fabrum]